MIKYILTAVFGFAVVLSLIGLSMKVADQSSEIEAKTAEIENLKNAQDQLIRSYEEDIAEREANTRNRKTTIKEIVKVAGNEKCINDTISNDVIIRVQQHGKSKK